MKSLNVLLCYKNFGAFQGISHIGLGVSATNNCKNLNRMGIHAQVFGLKCEDAIWEMMESNPKATHVVISAPWVKSETLSSLCAYYPETQFAVVSHSNVGFLQADSRGIVLIKEYMDLEASTYNFHLAANCKEFQTWIEETFKEPCTFLPNMYYLHHNHGRNKPCWDGGNLRIGVFGATRIQKNFTTAVAAAMQIASYLGVQTEIWVNSGRNDGPESQRLRSAMQQLTANMPNVELKFYNWSTWAHFKRMISTMNLLLQPSYTESFNMVTADGVAMGVPSVVSEVVTWAPNSWKARIDDVDDIARVGLGLLQNPRASHAGLVALKHYIKLGRTAWFEYLCENKFGNILG